MTRLSRTYIRDAEINVMLILVAAMAAVWFQIIGSFA